MAQRSESAAAAGDGAPTVRRGVARRALLGTLDEVLDTGTGLVVGPRGAGKTTLMAQWVRGCGLPTLWARAGRAGITLRSGSRTWTTTPAELGGVLRGPSAPTLLVLDDVHELRGAAAVELEQLLLSAPGQVRVLMGTRQQPSYTLARSEIGAPVVLTADDLRLRTWEVDRLFRDVHGHPLTPDDVETLTHETEGWAAAVHLFHRATDGLLPADRRRAVRALRSDTRYARDYLVGEVLAELDRPLVELLHRGSVFDELTAARCDALTAATPGDDPAVPAAPLLRELERVWSLAGTEDGVHFRLPRVLHRHLRSAYTERLGAAAHTWRDRAREVLAREAASQDASGAGGGTPPPVGAVRAARDDAVAGLLTSLAPALRRDPVSHVEDVRRVGGAAGALAEGLCLLLAGHQRRAAEPLRRAAADPDAPRELVLGAALAGAVLTGDRPVAVLRALDRVHVDADRHGHTWLARLAHGLILGLDGTAAARAQARAYAADRLADGDPWGSALVLTWSALAGLSVGAVEPEAWDELVRRWQALDAAVLAAWVRAGYALTAAAEQLPDAWQEARAAEAVARAAGAPGALAYAYAALARTGDQGSEELAALAESTGREAGVDMRPCWAVGLRRVRRAPVEAPRAPRPAPPAASAAASAHPGPDRVPRVEVSCLGEFRLVVDGTTADLSHVRPRARAVLHVLAVHAGRPVHREQLAEALWPDQDPRAALHNLHVSVSAVRRALEPRVPTRASRLLVRDGEAYTLVLRPGSTCDVDELERAVRTAIHRRAAGDLPAAAAALRRALDLYTGDLLPEDGPAEWVAGPRSRLRLLVADAAADLAELELERGEPAAAVVAAGRSIELDECRDRAWRLLVAGCTAAGDAAAAHRASLGYREMLDTLGVPVGGVPVAVAGATRPVTTGLGARPQRPPRASAGTRGRWS